jgi:hypothetical protein
LGDTIEQITTATGIKAAVDWFSEATGVDCGCDARKEKLNKLFRYRKPECLTQAGVRVHWHDERPQRGKRSATNGTE